jgi:hypothetical protein
MTVFHQVDTAIDLAEDFKHSLLGLPLFFFIQWLSFFEFSYELVAGLIVVDGIPDILLIPVAMIIPVRRKARQNNDSMAKLGPDVVGNYGEKACWKRVEATEKGLC